MTTPSSFVAEINPQLAEKLIQDLTSQEFTLTKPPYTFFAATKKGISCTLYTSGKLVVQGKEMKEFIEFYLEPEILQSFQFTHKHATLDLTPRIGIDESGKGDFFGPLCIAGVFAGGDQIKKLTDLGVCDSKKLSDGPIRKIAKGIRECCTCHIVRINPAKYNELYLKFRNLNTLLAWGHATAIENLIEKSQCQRVIIDQFADERVVLKALERKNLKPDLLQRHRGEEDLVVAAASILARDAFLYGLDKMAETFGMEFPKGASAKTIQTGKQFLAKLGEEALNQVGKLHFKTLDAITGKTRESGL